MKKDGLWMRIIPLLTGAVLVFTACDALIVSLKGRENPSDPNNPVPIITDFTASDLTHTSVTLSWTPQADTSGSYPSLLILYNTSAAPENIYDGTTVIDVALSADEVATTVTDLDLDTTTYYFGAWTYSEIDGEVQYTGPVSCSTPLIVTESLSVNADGYVYDMPAYDFSTTSFYAGYSAYNYNSLVRFSGIPGNSMYLNATLTIYCISSPATTQDVEVENILQEWDTSSITYTTTETTDFSEAVSNGTRTIDASFSGEIVFDVTEVFNAMQSGGVHHGFLIKGPASESFEFAASENTTYSGPKLEVEYYTLE